MRIMFVCHGNICRSPMAEFIFKKMIEERGAAQGFLVESSATSGEEIVCGVGNPVYPPARLELARHGIGCEGKRAVRLRADNYGEYDLFICMDNANLRNARLLFSGDPFAKCYRLMDFTERGGEVADPWYSDRFDIAYRDIVEGCVGLLTAILEGRIKEK